MDFSPYSLPACFSSTTSMDSQWPKRPPENARMATKNTVLGAIGPPIPRPMPKLSLFFFLGILPRSSSFFHAIPVGSRKGCCRINLFFFDIRYDILLHTHHSQHFCFLKMLLSAHNFSTTRFLSSSSSSMCDCSRK